MGGRYSDEWHVDHLNDPQSVVPESVMPKYGYLADTVIEPDHIGELLSVHAMLGTPYTEEMIAEAESDFKVQADPWGDYDGLKERYGEGIQVRNFDGQPELTEMDALVAYLQVLGTMVDFSTFQPDESR